MNTYSKRILPLIMAALMVLLTGCSLDSPEERREKEALKAAEKFVDDLEKAGALDQSYGFNILSNELFDVDFEYFPDGVVEIPSSVKWIGKDAFQGSEVLTSVIIPESVVDIDERAFKDCVNLQSVVINSEEIEIRSSAFEGCSALSDESKRRINQFNHEIFPEFTRSNSTTIKGEVFYKDIPVSRFFEGSIEDVLGQPLSNDLWDDGNRYYAYEGMQYIITSESSVSVTVNDLSLFKFNGESLDKSRDELVSIFGEAVDEWGISPDDSGMLYNFPDYSITFESHRVYGTTRMIISPN